jgi:plastocyanin
MTVFKCSLLLARRASSRTSTRRASPLIRRARALLLASLGAVVLVGLLTSCGSATGQTRPPVKAAYVYIVDAAGSNPFAFSPQKLTISVGTRVTWINRSSQPHTVTQSGEHPLFDSGSLYAIDPHHRWSFVFHRAGRFGYSCLLHPFMQASIVVHG